MTVARHRFSKHSLKAGIAIEVAVHLLGNGSLVSAATDNRIAEEVFELHVSYKES
jgi:hypothetical protein